MATTIETDLKEILGDFKQEFSNLNQRLDTIQKDVVDLRVSQQKDLIDLKVSQAEIRGDIRALDEKVTGLGKRLENQEFVNRSILVAIVATLLAGAAKLFGVLPNP